ncbi:MAG: Crp/Fnr family transcriptional regulator [Chloroflexota bacterium]
MPLTTQERRVWLEKVPLFSGCSDAVFDQLADVTAELAFDDGQAIVQQGQVGNGLYIVVTGGARIVGGSDELARLGPGDFLGELSVIDQRPRAASAFATGPTVCLALASWDLLAMLEQDPTLTLNLLKELVGRLRRTDAQLRH